jgi:acyl carrier protein
MSVVESRSADEVRQTIAELVLELAPKKDDAARDDPHLVDDLEYHSLAILELAFTLEDEFDLEPINEETAQKIGRLSDVQNFVIDTLQERAAAARA